MGFPARKSRQQRFTYADYLTWPDNERWEIINGVAFDMTPAPHPLHQLVSALLTSELVSFFKNKPCNVYPAPFDVRLPAGNESDEELDTVVQPDISIICDKKKIDKRGCKGAPDLVVEILSESTAERDFTEKRTLYEQSGVKEYWIVSIQTRTVSVFRQEKPGVFAKDVFVSETEHLSTPLFPGMSIPLAQVFPPPEDAE